MKQRGHRHSNRAKRGRRERYVPLASLYLDWRDRRVEVMAEAMRATIAKQLLPAGMTIGFEGANVASAQVFSDERRAFLSKLDTWGVATVFDVPKAPDGFDWVAIGRGACPCGMPYRGSGYALHEENGLVICRHCAELPNARELSKGIATFTPWMVTGSLE